MRDNFNATGFSELATIYCNQSHLTSCPRAYLYCPRVCTLKTVPMLRVTSQWRRRAQRIAALDGREQEAETASEGGEGAACGASRVCPHNELERVSKPMGNTTTHATTNIHLDVNAHNPIKHAQKHTHIHTHTNIHNNILTHKTNTHTKHTNTPIHNIPTHTHTHTHTNTHKTTS
jgi:hypothetical protein